MPRSGAKTGRGSRDQMFSGAGVLEDARMQDAGEEKFRFGGGRKKA